MTVARAQHDRSKSPARS